MVAQNAHLFKNPRLPRVTLVDQPWAVLIVVVESGLELVGVWFFVNVLLYPGQSRAALGDELFFACFRGDAGTL